jgi:hypothetical protein
MQKRVILTCMIGGVISFPFGVQVGRVYFDHVDTVSYLEGDAKNNNYGISIYEKDSDVPRALVAETLADELKLVELCPDNVRAYEGAIYCYCVLGAFREAKSLRHQAKSKGLSLGTMDEVIRDFEDSTPDKTVSPTEVKSLKQ